MALASIPSCNTLSFLHNFFLLRACSRCFMGKSNALSESVRSWDLESAPRPCQVPTNPASQRFAQRCPLPCIATAVQSYATCARARAKLRFRVQHRGKKRGRKNPAAAGRALALACVKVRTLLILTCRVLRLLHSRTHSARASAATSRTHGHRCGPPRAPGCALLETGLGR
jgi:hypothetical protein